MDRYVGEIMAYPSTHLADQAPHGWMLCEGQALGIEDYPELYQIIGITYGGVPGTSFCLPDLRGLAIMGAGTGEDLTMRPLNEICGSGMKYIGPDQMPAHSHGAVLSGLDGNITGTVTAKMKVNNNTSSGLLSPAGNYLGFSSYTELYIDESNLNLALPDDAITVDTKGLTIKNARGSSVCIDPTGSNEPINNMQPSLALAWIICVKGLMPQMQ